MKKQIALFFLAAGLTGMAFGQKIPDRPEGPPPPKPHQAQKGWAKQMPLKELEITDAQREAFKKQREAFRQRMEALKKEDNITVKEWRSKMETLRKENEASMQNILTKEQKLKWEQIRKEQQGRQFEGMKQQLGLTEEQAEKMKQQRAATQKQIEAIRNNKALSTQEKKESVKKLMKAQKESFDSLLTPEQKAKRKEMHPPRGPNRRPHRPGMAPPPDGPTPPLQNT
jgi:hypothetical protein